MIEDSANAQNETEDDDEILVSEGEDGELTGKVMPNPHSMLHIIFLVGINFSLFFQMRPAKQMFSLKIT